MAALGICNHSFLGIYVVKAKNALTAQCAYLGWCWAQWTGNGVFHLVLRCIYSVKAKHALTAQRAKWSRLRALPPWTVIFMHFWFLSRFCSSYVRHGRLGTLYFFFLLGFPCVPPLLPILPRLSGSQSWKLHRPPSGPPAQARTKATWIPLRWASPWFVLSLFPLVCSSFLALSLRIGIGLNVDLKVDTVV